MAVLPGLRGQHHAQLLEGLLVRIAEHPRRMHLAAAQARKLAQGQIGQLAAFRAGGKGNQHLFHVEKRVSASVTNEEGSNEQSSS